MGDAENYTEQLRDPYYITSINKSTVDGMNTWYTNKI